MMISVIILNPVEMYVQLYTALSGQLVTIWLLTCVVMEFHVLVMIIVGH